MILFLSPLCPEGYRLCFSPSQLQVQPKGFPCIWAKPNHTIHLTLGSLTLLLSHPSSILKHFHPHCTRLQCLQPITKVFTCLGHLSASPRVLLFHYFLSHGKKSLKRKELKLIFLCYSAIIKKPGSRYTT